MFQKIFCGLLVLILPLNSFAEEPFKVGVVIAQTGAAAKYGKFSLMGLELAQEEINAAGGVAGQPLELIIEDSQTQNAQGLNAFNNLVNQKKVTAVIGDLWEFLTNPLIPVAERKKIPLLSPTVMPHAITGTSPYFFTLGHQINNLDSAFELYFLKHPEIKTIALINWENDWGLGYSKKVKEIIKKLKLELVEEVNTLDWNNDFKTEVTKIMRKKPDLIFVPYLAERVARRLKELKSPAKILTTLNIVEPLLDPNVNKELLEGIYYVDFAAPQNYNEKFQARFKEQPQYESHLSYEALRSLVKAYENNPTDLQSGLKMLEYQGVSGKIDFQKSNFGNEAKAVLYHITKGEAYRENCYPFTR